jgi:hypothetical protein
VIEAAASSRSFIGTDVGDVYEKNNGYIHIQRKQGKAAKAVNKDDLSLRRKAIF